MEIRQAELPDFESVHDLICELALYEKAPAEVITDPEILAQHCLANNPFVFCWVCVHDHQILGTAICYIRYSTWKGPVLYLEDIVVKESSRRKGVGTALLNHLIAFAKKRKFERISWQVLDWNQPAIDFYKKFDVNFDESWINVTHQLNQNVSRIPKIDFLPRFRLCNSCFGFL